jgi:transcriptional regulator GlxA family with amidase domain
MSKSRLVSRFRDQVGVTPKVYSRLIRFRRACAMLDAGGASLADVAVAAGYYDQPHMNAEFRELAGLTPREFLAVRYPGGSTAAESVDF